MTDIDPVPLAQLPANMPDGIRPMIAIVRAQPAKRTNSERN